MTETVYKVVYYEVIDNHDLGGTSKAYRTMFKTKSFEDFMEFVELKGLVN